MSFWVKHKCELDGLMMVQGSMSGSGACLPLCSAPRVLLPSRLAPGLTGPFVLVENERDSKMNGFLLAGPAGTVQRALGSQGSVPGLRAGPGGGEVEADSAAMCCTPVCPSHGRSDSLLGWNVECRSVATRARARVTQARLSHIAELWIRERVQVESEHLQDDF